VTLSDPVSKYLPEGVKLPERGGKSITLVDLSTHTSGLPRMPTNFAPKDAANPYADYTVEQMYQFLAGYSLPRDIGSKYEYSNLGGGLLGHVLARRAGQSYEDLVRARIIRPLGLNDTGITLTAGMKERLAVGHDERLKPASNWDLPALAGAGALRSTGNDMLTFVGAFLGYQETPLAPAMKAMLETRRPAQPPMETGLAWLVLKPGSQTIVWHDGGTGGYRSFVGFDPDARVGVVVLANAGTMVGVDDIGLHLLAPAVPLANPQPPKDHKEVTIDPKLLDRYVGRYQLAPTFSITITREGDRLFAQATGQGKLDLFAEGEHDFFLKAVDAQMTFEVSGTGPASALVLHQNGRDQRAARAE
jgi:CubicO group peptidase (beta-lactamase class C family)